MDFNWNIKGYSEEDLERAEALSKEFSLLTPTALILLQRGLSSSEEVRKYLYPSLKNLHDPFLMKDMNKAVDRLNKAISEHQKIMIYGDYDVDGTTSVSLIYRFLRETVYSDKYLNFYIPDRHDDGYGVSFRGINFAKEWGAELIIVLDCGVKAVEEIAYAKSIGIDFIVCDHHHPGEILPDAVAILDPKRADNTYPFEHLSGCGVGFKFMQAFAIRNAISLSFLYKHLELLALSIAADLVPIIDENRILAYYGLRQLNNKPSLGVKGLMSISELEGKTIDIDSIMFKIGPRINASGRMMNGKEAVKLLISKDANKVKRKSSELDKYNNQRRELDIQTTQEAINIIKQNPALLNKKIIVLRNEEWHKGVVGIVASRIAEKYNRPTIVLTRCNEDNYSGSARSVSGFDLYKAIESHKDLLGNFGGHPFAVGLTVPKNNVDTFTLDIENYAMQNIENAEIKKNIDVDLALDIDKINFRLLKELQYLAPFGVGNEKPVFMSDGLCDAGYSKIVGNDKKHIKLTICKYLEKQKIFRGIAFRQAKYAQNIISGNEFSIIYTLSENEFAGQKQLQLLVRDICIK